LLHLNRIDRVALALLLSRYGLALTLIAPEEVIPGSYWGDSEAGLKGDRLYARMDTPVHSVLHEASHYICMSPERRSGLDRDAGGDDAEESAVCYLQVLLADELPESGASASLATWTTGATVSGWATLEPGSVRMPRMRAGGWWSTAWLMRRAG